MSVGSILIKCTPFFVVAGYGVYLLVECFFPSWREAGWGHWSIYTGHDSGGDAPMKPSRVIAEGDLPERPARLLYFCLGVAALLIAFVGIRHFAGVPAAAPDVLGRLSG